MATNHLCACGCGGTTSLVLRSNRKKGLVRGAFRQFLRGHNKPTADGHSEQAKAKIGRSHIGIRPSAETLEKMSAAKAGIPTGRHASPSDETKNKIRQTMVSRGISPTQRYRPLKGTPLSVACYAALRKPEVKVRRIAALVVALKDPEVQRRRASAASKNARKSTSIERSVAALLDALGVVYQSQKAIDRYVVDYFVPSKNLVIECDGLYWHSLPSVRAKDQRRDAFLRAAGYRILRLPEDQIKAGIVADVLRLAVA